jgi:hypothetical protein
MKSVRSASTTCAVQIHGVVIPSVWQDFPILAREPIVPDSPDVIFMRKSNRMPDVTAEIPIGGYERLAATTSEDCMNRWLAIVLGISIAPATLVRAQPVELPEPTHQRGPTDHSVLLPPIPDVPVKGPNNTRERYGEFSISGGLLLVRPVFSANPAYSVNGRAAEFSQRLQASPDVWLSYTPERGWGVRGRWFQFDHTASASYAALPGETIRGITSIPIGQTPIAGTVRADSHLFVSMFDVQATRHFDYETWTHLIGVGVRYAHMSQDYRANLADPDTHIALTSGHNMNGWGPSLSWDAKRRLGDSGFAIYSQTQFAVVIGTAHGSALALNNGLRGDAERSDPEALPIGELEAGVEYQRAWGGRRLFLQSAFIGQLWWGGGNANNFDSPADSNFGFLGLVLRGGVRY